MKKYINRAIKFVAALLIFTIIFRYLFGVRGIMKMGTNVAQNVSYYQTFYDLPKNSLDGIVLGNSVSHRGWSDVTAWHESGIAVYSLASESQPFPFTKYIIEEALKTQDLKFVVVELHGIRSNVFYDPTEAFLRRVTDAMPMSKNKLDLVKASIEHIDKLNEYNKERENNYPQIQLDEASFKLPFLKYHSNWQNLKQVDYDDVRSKTMSTYVGEHLCEIAKVDPLGDINVFGYTDETCELSEYQKNSVVDLLDYLKEKDLKTIFVSFPSKMTKAEQMEMNETMKIIKDYGCDKFSICNMNSPDVYSSSNEGINAELKIDWTTDFYGKDHLNSYGSDKTTKYLLKHIKEKVDFEDKRDKKGYEVWNKAYDRYVKITKKGWEKSYTLTPFEDWKKVGGWTVKSWDNFVTKLLKEEKKK